VVARKALRLCCWGDFVDLALGLMSSPGGVVFVCIWVAQSRAWDLSPTSFCLVGIVDG
jgi:hypothetical protein